MTGRPGPGSGGLDFRVYLANKHRKLDDQLAKDLKSSIFDGCTIYITGHTEPSARLLAEMITANGGKICPFYGSKGSATHVVAQSLTSRKNKLWADRAVATPLWIVKSIEAGKRLKWSDFRTIPADPTAGGGSATKDANERAWIVRERSKVNCLDPNFLKDYYEKSRLHFLSTEKRQLRQDTLNIGYHTPNASAQTILHIDFDSFFVAAALKKRPDLVDKPVCVSHGSDSSDIASCNYVAREFGLKNGMWVGHAKTLCKDLICLPYDFPVYKQFSVALYDAIKQLEPDYICPVSVDEALVNVTNCLAKRLDSLEELITTLRATVFEATGIHVSVGSGPNILLAKIALRQAKPNGYKIFESEKDALSLILDLSVDQIPGIGRATLYKLQQLGVNTIRDIKSCSIEQLSSAVGPALTRKLIAATLGQDSNDLSTLNAPTKTMGVDIAWGVRLLSEEEVQQFASNVCTELWNRLEPGLVVASGVVKLYEMAKGADFEAEKYMGCGRCQVHNRKMAGSLSGLQDLQAAVLAIIMHFNIRPLRFRGMGVQLKLDDNQPRTPQQKQNQLRINDFPQQSRVPHKEREFVYVAPKRRRMTLTQMTTTTKIDESVLDQFPEEIRLEVSKNPELFNIRLTRSNHRQETPHHLPLAKKCDTEPYIPVRFMNEVPSEQEVRLVISEWIENFPDGPFHEDAMDFYNYIKELLEQDWNWLRAVNLVDWLKFKTSKVCEQWQYFSQLVEDLIEPERTSQGS